MVIEFAPPHLPIPPITHVFAKSVWLYTYWRLSWHDSFYSCHQKLQTQFFIDLHCHFNHCKRLDCVFGLFSSAFRQILHLPGRREDLKIVKKKKNDWWAEDTCAMHLHLIVLLTKTFGNHNNSTGSALFGTNWYIMVDVITWKSLQVCCNTVFLRKIVWMLRILFIKYIFGEKTFLLFHIIFTTTWFF